MDTGFEPHTLLDDVAPLQDFFESRDQLSHRDFSQETQTPQVDTENGDLTLLEQARHTQQGAIAPQHHDKVYQIRDGGSGIAGGFTDRRGCVHIEKCLNMMAGEPGQETVQQYR